MLTGLVYNFHPATLYQHERWCPRNDFRHQMIRGKPTEATVHWLCLSSIQYILVMTIMINGVHLNDKTCQSSGILTHQHYQASDWTSPNDCGWTIGLCPQPCLSKHSVQYDTTSLLTGLSAMCCVKISSYYNGNETPCRWSIPHTQEQIIHLSSPLQNQQQLCFPSQQHNTGLQSSVCLYI